MTEKRQQENVSEFRKPLDTYIDEYQDVEKIVVDFDKDSGTFTPRRQKTRIAVPTIYTRGITTPLTCGDGKHFWEMIDRHKHIAKCKNCTKHRFLRAAYETIKDGHILDRETKTLID